MKCSISSSDPLCIKTAGTKKITHIYSSVLKYRGHHSPASLLLNEESFFNTLQNRSHLIDSHLVSSMEIIALP